VEKPCATFRKPERMVSQKLIDELFSGGHSCSLAAYPLRMVYMVRERQQGAEPVQLLISVPKKRLHHAVDRNRLKRQVREAYRLNKHRLESTLPDNEQLVVAFIWLAEGLESTDTVAARVKSLLKRISVKLQTKNS
jgi:ribonuclease P protein component